MPAVFIWHLDFNGQKPQQASSNGVTIFRYSLFFNSCIICSTRLLGFPSSWLISSILGSPFDKCSLALFNDQIFSPLKLIRLSCMALSLNFLSSGSFYDGVSEWKGN